MDLYIKSQIQKQVNFTLVKKCSSTTKRKKLTKKELAEQTGRGRKSTTKVEQVDSGWQTYWGSSKDLLADIKTLGKDKFQRVIIDFCDTKKQLTYAEIYHHEAYRDWENSLEKTLISQNNLLYFRLWKMLPS